MHFMKSQGAPCVGAGWIAACLLLLIAISPPLGAETVHALCRQSGALNVIPIAIDAVTGNGTPLASTTTGPDSEGHFDGTTDDTGKLVAGFTARQGGNGPYSESLIAIDTGTGTVQTSTSALPGNAFSGNSNRINYDFPPLLVFVAQSSGTDASVHLFQIDAGTGSVTGSVNLPFAASGRGPRRTPAQPFSDITAGQTVNVALPPECGTVTGFAGVLP